MVTHHHQATALVAAPAEAAALLALSDERDHWLARVLASWREGFAAGRRAGWREGYAAATADQRDEWITTRRLLHNATAPVLDPQGWSREQEREAARVVRAAEAATRRDAAERYDAFVARAYNTPAPQRSDAQLATVRTCPPPSRGHLRRAQ